MRLDKLDRDITQIVERIDRGQLDLQPDFQRGQVWSERKKQRLIDSILRNWYIPPIHVVAKPNDSTEEILDGQQRLRAIHEFVNDEFCIDGDLEPTSNAIKRLDGKRYSELNTRTKLGFDRFNIITFRLLDYRPSEPGELFFRLNQIVSLTSAEQRNSLFGPTRDQVRGLAKLFEERTADKLLGFSNSRLNYDDIISRLALAVELGGITYKVGANQLEDRFRSQEAFSDRTYVIVANAIKRLTRAVRASSARIKFNKASTFSWLYFIADNKWPSDYPYTEEFANFLAAFETARNANIGLADLSSESKHLAVRFSNSAYVFTNIFTNRTSSRINDVSSIILRDICLNATLCLYGPSGLKEFPRFKNKRQIIDLMPAAYERTSNRMVEIDLERQALSVGWGQFR